MFEWIVLWVVVSVVGLFASIGLAIRDYRRRMALVREVGGVDGVAFSDAPPQATHASGAAYRPWSADQAGLPCRYWVRWKACTSPPVEGTGAFALQETIHSPEILGVVAEAIVNGLRDKGLRVDLGSVHILDWQRFEAPSQDPGGRDAKPRAAVQGHGSVIAFSRVA